MDAPTSKPTQAEPGPDPPAFRGWMALALALAPALTAIAWVPEFTTQDGPAHLYNAQILNASLRPESPFSGTFEVAWQPLPNWSGHLGTMALVSFLPPSIAGRLMTAITLVLFSISVVWLRLVVAGTKGLATSAVLAVLLGLNVTWLLGFTSFLLGAALMPTTLAVWWVGREWFGPLRALGLAVLLVLGYFSHPISLGLTIAGLGLLAILTPGLDRVHRGLWTLASFLPLAPLVWIYRSLTWSGGKMEPVWEHLANPWSIRSWVGQVGWIDPLTLAGKTYRPFSPVASVTNGLFSPAIWAFLGIGLLAIFTWKRREGDRAGWLALAVLLLLGGLFGPDTLGVKHGHYLPQRVALLGLVALVPWLDLSFDRWSIKVASGLLVVALVLQSTFVWDYALDCRENVGPLLQARPAFGRNQRVGTLLTGIKGRFRSNPLLHADCLFGVEGGNVIWDNYETAHYYFPVKIRPGLDHPPASEFEEIAVLDAPVEGLERARRWDSLLAEHGESIDVILEWSLDRHPELDTINIRRGYLVIYHDGPVRVWDRRAGKINP